MLSHLLNFGLILSLVTANGLFTRLTADGRQTKGAATTDLTKSLSVIEKTIEEKRIELGISGASLVIVKDDKIILIKGFGLRDVERQLPVTPDTLFAAASVTKSFTALATMMSVDEGKLALDDSPKKFLSYLKFNDPEIGANITIRDLLSHRTGFANANWAWQTGTLNRTETIKVAALAKPTAKLRERFQYNNIMYSVAGEVVAKAQNTTYENFITSRILKPLDMQASNLSLKEMQKSQNFSFGYEYIPTTKTHIKVPMRNLTNIAPAAALNSNAKDMAQLVRLMLGGGTINGKRLVSEKSFNEMLTPQINIGQTGFWGLGLASRGTWNGKRVFFHSGSIDGFSSVVALMPDEKLGFALLVNAENSRLRGVAEDVIWDNLVGKREATTNNISPNSPVNNQQTNFVSPISVDELMSKMIEAAGGETNLRKHKSFIQKITVDFQQQGITGEGTVSAEAPNMWTRDITLYALGKKIGTSYEYFDNGRGGWKTSFLPLQELTGDSLQDLKTDSDFYSLLNWKTLFKTVAIKSVSKIDGEDVYVVLKTPEKGTPVTDYVSAKSFLLQQRDTSNGGTVSFRDYKNVDGVQMPFTRIEYLPGIGNISTKTLRVSRKVAWRQAAW